jgi:hypothetical protein
VKATSKGFCPYIGVGVVNWIGRALGVATWQAGVCKGMAPTR